MNFDATIDQVRVRVLPDGRLSREDAAMYLGKSTKTLAMWAMTGKGPKSIRVGGRVFYYQRDLDAFIRGEAV
jgi:hypothetical protein